MTAILENRTVESETLVRDYLDSRDSGLREQIIESFAPYVHYIAGRIAIPPGAVLDHGDLFQHGIIGLLFALERYQVSRGVLFKTFAYSRIRGEMYDALRREGLVNRTRARRLREVEDAIVRLRLKLERDPLPEEVCQALGIRESEYYDLVLSAHLTYSVPMSGDMRSESRDVEQLEDMEQLAPDEQLNRKELQEAIKAIMQQLPARQGIILTLYFVEELTLANIAEVLSLSEARVSQLLSESLLTIRTHLHGNGQE